MESEDEQSDFEADKRVKSGRKYQQNKHTNSDSHKQPYTINRKQPYSRDQQQNKRSDNYTKGRYVYQSSKTRVQQIGTIQTPQTVKVKNSARSVDFVLPTNNRFEALAQSEQNMSNNDDTVKLNASASRKHSASSPLDQDKTSKKLREHSGSSSDQSDIDIEIDISPQCDPPSVRNGETSMKESYNTSINLDPQTDSVVLNKGPVLKVGFTRDQIDTNDLNNQ